jgi:uncharacterized protein YwqG
MAMRMFSRLFGPRKPKDPPRDLGPLVRGLERPAAHLLKTNTATNSHIGGSPEVASDFTWPSKEGVLLGFLAQVNLQELAATHTIEWLPESGDLLFFYDLQEQPWGFDPKHRGGWSVIYLPNSDGKRTERLAPGDLPKESLLAKANVTFRQVNTFPSAMADIDELQLTDEELDNYSEYQEAQFAQHPQHQIGGFASPIQGEMELECQLASNGLYCGDSSGYGDPRAKLLGEAAHEWRLLLQLDSDDDCNVMWGDGGRLYFWIREEDARSKNFNRAWVILQCH